MAGSNNRLSINPKSPHHDKALLQRGIGIRFNGVEKTNVEEYCVSEGWVRVTVGKTMAFDGIRITMKLKGTDDAIFLDYIDNKNLNHIKQYV